MTAVRVVLEVLIALGQWWVFRAIGLHIPLVVCVAYMLVGGEPLWRFLIKNATHIP